MNEARVKDLFQRAFELPESERFAFVTRECDGDEALCASVLDLLEAHGEADDFLDRPASVTFPLAEAHVPTERAGDRIGVFRLVEPIGEGGFGNVWRAEQEVPVHRDVAVKIVKLGMHTAQVVRRFEQEREALARMDHPHIAKVFDGGATADGRPWFAMELVDGAAITQFCDRHQLSTGKRLELLADVCRAIQHGHNKGIVHRDIKPSNVLVSIHDGKPMPRVIDFGIAKALDRDGTQHTLLRTDQGLLGTPEYMSPEQVLDSGDVDARTDVYSLGVLLYELVTGTRPFDARRSGAGAHEVLRQIREQAPERPSTRIGRLDGGEAAAAVAARSATRRELLRQVRGDVDWITLRALEKDRDRRYTTAEQLAADLDRCLRNEPVLAGPPSTAYRLSKFARRHRTALGLVVLAAASLLAGTGLAVHGLLEAQAAEERERAEAERARLALIELEQLLFAADPRSARGPGFTVRELLDEFAARLTKRPPADEVVAARIHAQLGRTYRSLGQLDAAAVHLDEALAIRKRVLPADDPAVQTSLADYALLLVDRGRYAEAARRLQAVIPYWRARPGGAVRLAFHLNMLANALSSSGRHGDAIAAAREALEICERELGGHARDTAHCRARLVQVEVVGGRAARPIEQLTAAIQGLEAHISPHHPDVLGLRHNLGAVLERADRIDEAEAAYRTALSGRARVNGDDHPATASTKLALGSLLYRRGNLDDGLPLMRQAVETLKSVHGGPHPFLGGALLRLGDGLRAAGATAEAIATLEQAVATLRASADAPAGELAGALSNLALALWSGGRRGEALERIEAALALLPADEPTVRMTRVVVLTNLGRMRHESDQKDAAVAALEAAATAARALWPEDHAQRRLIERYLAEARAGRR